VDSVSLLEPTPLTIGFNVVQVACTGGNNGSATAIVSGGNAPYTYAWGTSPLQTNPTAVGLTAGNYSVLVTDSKGCTNTNSVAITPQPGTLVISATASGTACGTNSNAVITSNVSNGSPTYTYSWQPGGQTTPNISNALGGTHTVSVTDGNNCVATTTVAVPAGSTPPIANFTFTPSISCEGMNVQFTDSSTNALTWLWDFGGTGSSTEQHPGFTFPYSGNYTVTLIVANPPCEDTLSVPLVIGDLGSGIVFSDANVFTPNNDGINDCFHPAMINSATGLPDNALRQCMFLEVFDRWGVKMYESIGLNGINCWDGNNKLDTKPAPDGTYYYIAELGTTLIKGYITLARHK
jgi:gliding motility-associated-like protein